MDFDVVIAGAGPGGALAAREMAQAGHSVGLFDAASMEKIGRPIVVDVERSIFPEVGIEPPSGDEVPFQQKRTRILSSRGMPGFILDAEHLSVSVRLDRFVGRLLREAEAHGVQVFPGSKAEAPLLSNGRVAGVRFARGEAREEVGARLVIDATGFDAALVRVLDPGLGWGFEDRNEDKVMAGNHLHRIDPDRASQAVAAGVHADDEVWIRLGGFGNYSTEYSYLSLADEKAYVLIGMRAMAPFSLPEVLESFKAGQGYYGSWLYGGAGPIRVRRSLDRLVSDGFMVIGEAACQVIPTNGSGVASALHAAHLASQVASEALKTGTPTSGRLWPYAWAYQSGRGAVLASYDANIRIIEGLRNEQIAAFIESGVMQPEDALQTAALKPVSPSFRSLPCRAMGLLKHPGLLGMLMKVALKAPRVKSHYIRYPKIEDVRAFEAWGRGARALFPDPKREEWG